MAVQKFARTFDSFPAIVGSGVVTNLLLLRATAGTITRIDVFTGGNLESFPATFNVRLNGTALFSGGNRPQVTVGSQTVSKTGLNVAVAHGDKLTLDLENFPKIPQMTPVFWFVWIDDGTGGETAASLGNLINSAAAKTTPVNADNFAYSDSESSNILKKFTWLNLKTALKTVFDAIYVTGALSATDSAIALFDGTSGELIKDSAKTLSTDSTLASNSDQKIPTEKAVKTYVDAHSGGGLSLAQTTATATTGSIADTVSEDGTVPLGKYAIVSRLEASRACRVRLYSTAGYRTADASRAVGTDPTGEHGVLLDAILTTDNLTLDLSPIVQVFDGASPRTGNIFYSIQNRSGVTGTVAVVFTKLTFEA